MFNLSSHPILVAVGVLLGSFLGWWWLWLPLFIIYGLSRSPWWLVIFLVIVDAYYGSFHTWPFLSVAGFAILVTLEFVRPYLYTTNKYAIQN